MSRLAIAGLAMALLGAPVMAEEFGIMNEKHPEEGVVFGGQVSQEQLDALSGAGFKTVIDLRGEGEDRGFDEDAAIGATGMNYVKVPVTGELAAKPETWESFFEAFEAAEKPVLVHCASGNRVGAMYYAWLASEKGVARDEALATAKENGLRSEALVDLANQYLDGQ